MSSAQGSAGTMLMAFTNLEELESLAQKVMTKQAFDYYRSGSHSEATVGFNRASFMQFKILPRILVDVSQVDTSVTFLGHKLPWPILVAPMAMQKLAHEDGELAVARACGKQSIGMIQSTMGTVPLAEVCKIGKRSRVPVMMFQLYVVKDRAFTAKLIKDAENAGYEALVITVDAPQLGRREADERNNFSLPKTMKLENLDGLARAGSHGQTSAPGSAIAQVFASYVDPTLTWKFIAWVRGVTALPLVLKSCNILVSRAFRLEGFLCELRAEPTFDVGSLLRTMGILAAADAELAVESGIDAIIVSNHGGRQLDFAPSALEVLPQIAAAVNKRLPIWIDGGVRRGTDVIKALALGASGVLLGRPAIFALAIGGQSGVEKALSILKDELKLSLQLMGCPTLSQLTAERLLPSSVPISRL